MLENALRARLLGGVALARHTLGADDHHLARLHFIQIHRAHQVESAGFRREYVRDAAAGKFHLPRGQWPETVRIARHDDAVFGQKDQ